MSYDIWTRCEGASEIGPLLLDPWRVVEAQHLISTRKLVDSDEEQVLLEHMIEEVKPTGPRLPLHYLLLTPFRYPPLAYGSRFGTTLEPAIWYGSEEVPTALAESAYYRLLFLEGSRAELGPVRTELTAFRVRMHTTRGVDLTRAPFETYRDRISDPAAYAVSQALGRAMRKAGVAAFRYTSARDPSAGANVGAFEPAVFGKAKPRSLHTWTCTATPDGVEFRKRDYFERVVHAFPRAEFEVEGQLPTPAP